MLGNNIGPMFDNLPASLPHSRAGEAARAGRGRADALALAARGADHRRGRPQGYALEPGSASTAPANLPAPIVKALNEAFVEALAHPT